MAFFIETERTILNLMRTTGRKNRNIQIDKIPKATSSKRTKLQYLISKHTAKL